MSTLSIVVAGAGGRMGRAIMKEILDTEGISLIGGVEQKGVPVIGEDLGVLATGQPTGQMVSTDLEASLAKADAVIDFTRPEPSLDIARAAAACGVAHIIGTTGFSDDQTAELGKIAGTIPIVKSGNMSLGVNLLTALVEQAARATGINFDIEITEAHHRAKVDAPSGTALMLGEAAAAGRGVKLAQKSAGMAGDRNGARGAGNIGFSVIRGGGVIGDHSVRFMGESETLTLSHQAIDRSLFAKGAVAAAQWAPGQRPGLYSMIDVLGLSSA